MWLAHIGHCLVTEINEIRVGLVPPIRLIVRPHCDLTEMVPAATPAAAAILTRIHYFCYKYVNRFASGMTAP
jgi:hypothetical protein